MWSAEIVCLLEHTCQVVKPSLFARLLAFAMAGPKEVKVYQSALSELVDQWHPQASQEKQVQDLRAVECAKLPSVETEKPSKDSPTEAHASTGSHMGAGMYPSMPQHLDVIAKGLLLAAEAHGCLVSPNDGVPLVQIDRKKRKITICRVTPEEMQQAGSLCSQPSSSSGAC